MPRQVSATRWLPACVVVCTVVWCVEMLVGCPFAG